MACSQHEAEGIAANDFCNICLAISLFHLTAYFMRGPLLQGGLFHYFFNLKINDRPFLPFLIA